MAFQLLNGQKTWSCIRDENGHREYKIKFRVMSTSPYDGPALALQTPGLPIPGNFWLVDNDLDLWAWVRWNTIVTPVVENEPNYYFDLEYTAGTKPIGMMGNGQPWGTCNQAQIENPLLQPAHVSMSFINRRENAHVNRFRVPIKNSAHELIKSNETQFDVGYPQITIEQNLVAVNALWLQSVNCVNAYPFWGLPPRCVRLSSLAIENKFYGFCFQYCTLRVTFDIDPTTWDRYVQDVGTKCLRGKWENGAWTLTDIGGLPPKPSNPAHFMKAVDVYGNLTSVVLDGLGKPISGSTSGVITNIDTSLSTVYVTSAAHGLATGDQVKITGARGIYLQKLVDGVLRPSRKFTITVVDVDTFTLNDGRMSGFFDTSLYATWFRVSGNIPGKILVEFYNEVDFLPLGVPLTPLPIVGTVDPDPE